MMEFSPRCFSSTRRVFTRYSPSLEQPSYCPTVSVKFGIVLVTPLIVSVTEMPG
jgi:hypothetical protein